LAASSIDGIVEASGALAPTERERAMAKFVLSFRAATDRQADADQEAAWGKWFEQIGASVAEWGHRVGRVSALGSAKSSSDALAGYVVVEADDLSAAVSIAEGCPGLRHGGGVEVGEAVDA
jgi:hypothetical protein